jgi:hypothetical protein
MLSPRTTKVIYVDIVEELQRDAVDKLGFLFEEPEGDVGVNRGGQEGGEHDSRPLCRCLGKHKSPGQRVSAWASRGALGGIRTPNLLIRSQMLYPLSYERWTTSSNDTWRGRV